MMRIRPAWLLALLLALPAGCGGELRSWQKEGVGPELRAEDESFCHRFARAEVAREGYARRGAAMVPNFSVQRGDGRVKQTFQNEAAAEQLAQNARRHDLFSRCMEEKGYQFR